MSQKTKKGTKLILKATSKQGTLLMWDDDFSALSFSSLACQWPFRGDILRRGKTWRVHPLSKALTCNDVPSVSVPLA